MNTRLRICVVFLALFFLSTFSLMAQPWLEDFESGSLSNWTQQVSTATPGSVSASAELYSIQLQAQGVGYKKANNVTGFAGTNMVTANIGACQGAPVNTDVIAKNSASTVSGIINDYTPVIAFNPCNNSVTVVDVTPFVVGDRALIIQMKGATIDLTNTAAFGNITNLGDAGNYEFVQIAAINGSDVQFVNTLLNSYTVSGLVQLITVPQYIDVTVTGTLTCQPWNGTVGGVLVFEASGTVTLNSDIDVSDKGFRPGTSSNNAPYSCNQQDYFYPLASTFGGRKGEGICILPNTYVNGRGKNVNGGGGGNDTNSGGAGGGNHGVGGRGGNQWIGCTNLAIGGEGGLALPYNNGVLNRVFLGGGGGGGHQNDGTATPGTSGGGIVILRASNLDVLGGSVRANSLDALPSNGDGSGGAGGGGTAILDVSSVSGNLTVDITGGNGGNNSSHGPGGGGGGGLLRTTNPLGGNVTVLLQGGQAGFHSVYGTTHGATDGDDGGVFSGLSINESTTPWSPIDTPFFTFNTPCIGETLILSSLWSSPTPVTFAWTGPGSFSATGQNTSVPNATAVNTGTYTLTVTHVSGCTSSWDTLVTLLPLPLVNAGSDTSVCPNGAVQLGATGALMYQWSPAIGLNNSNVANPAFTAGNTTIFSVTGTDANGCSATDDVNVNVLTVSTTQLSVNICDGTPYTLPDGTVVTQGGTYQSVLVSFQGCDSIINTTLNVWPVFNLTIFDTICNGSNYTYNGITYNQSGNYTHLFQTIQGCDSTVVLSLTVNQTSRDTTIAAICSGSSYVFEGNPYTVPGTYTSTLVSSSGCDSIKVLLLSLNNSYFDTASYSICSGTWYVLPNGDSVNQSGNYTTALQTVSGCDSTISINLNILPGYNITVYDTVCEKESYLLPNGVNVIGGGSYTSILNAINGCDSTITVQLVVNNEPAWITLDITPANPTVNLGDTTIINTQTNLSGPVNYNWQPLVGLSCYDCESPVFFGNNTTIYTLQVSDTNGCFKQTSAQVEVIPDYSLYIPNAFSPNGDGQNDFWQLFGNVRTIKHFHVKVFNRWGEKVFESNDIDYQWDGGFKSQEQPSGVYVYDIEVEWIDNSRAQSYNGRVTLLR